MEISLPPGTLQGYHYEAPFDDLKLLSHCGEEVCAPSHCVPRHEHDRFELCYLVRGNAWWETRRQLYAHRKDEVYLAYPGERHWTADRPRHKGYHILYAGVDFDALGPLGRQFSQLFLLDRRHIIAHCQDVEPILRSVIRQIGRDSPYTVTVTTCLLQTLAALLIQKLAGSQRTEPATYHSIPIQNVLLYLQQHTDRRVELSELADVAGLSVSQMSRRFNQEVGTTPAAAHLQIRLSASREALRQPGFDVTHVSYQFGFSSSQHFCRAFGKAFGVSPSRWRQRQSRPEPINATSR
ncbi:MAG: helix-turn-helix transcriptional regulator [Phycisphaeraceae bacterium]|nr:helix-turn-helix transcriptional regulator [Phycisphaeraceae bacterium]